MIVVISDLHLQHTGRDPLRYRDERGGISEIGVRRNVAAGALRLLLEEVADAAPETTRKLELVLAGDIFELHRTPLWFEGGSTLRPTAVDPTADRALEGMILRIVDAIAEENAEFFEVLRTFAATKSYVREATSRTLERLDEVVIHFIPGNHDRLANAWPSVRRRIRQVLGMPDSDAAFPHVIERPHGDSDNYGIRIRHGHEYDASNSRFTPGEEIPDPDDHRYLLPCIGDVGTIDIASRLATVFRVRYADVLRQATPEGLQLRQLYRLLTEFDDVRPQMLLLQYLHHHVGARDAVIFDRLRPVLWDVYHALVRDPFFRAESQRTNRSKYIDPPIREVIEEGLRHVGGDVIAWLARHAPAPEDPRPVVGPAQFARKERGLAEGTISIVISGHTHEAEAVAISARRPEEGFYLNSGTWRTRVRAGVGDENDIPFARIRTYAMVFCYAESERTESNDHRRFETWTGNLSADTWAASGYGPYDVPRGPSRPSGRRLHVVRIRVTRIDEGATLDGAELRLHFGVDDRVQLIAKDHVKNGDVLDMAALAPFELDAALEGEITCWGVEADRGPDDVIDPDDALPWAIAWIRRAGGDFAACEGQLVLHDAETTIAIDWRVA